MGARGLRARAGVRCAQAGRIPAAPSPHHAHGDEGGALRIDAVLGYRPVTFEPVAAVERLGARIAVRHPQERGRVADHDIQQRLAEPGPLCLGQQIDPLEFAFARGIAVGGQRVRPADG